ncbi:MAG: DUF1015 domain-containing protein [Anaerohalosphaeraceae bacterium]
MDIKPFRALRFNPEVVGDPGTCIAPPYDVIDEQAQRELYHANPYNIVRATKGLKYPEDDERCNVYTRAADYLREAIQQKALVYDEQEALYGYVQDFTIAGKRYQRSGIVALGRLEPFGKGIRPHEKTLDGPKADRLNLMRATAAQFGQIFMLYDDPSRTAEQMIQEAMQKSPVLDFTDKENVRHRLYIIRQEQAVLQFAQMMKSKSGIIADGHHRYETALNYWLETQNPNAQWQMMTFVNTYNEGLVIQPTHRLLWGLSDFSAAALLDAMKADFQIERLGWTDEPQKKQACSNMFERMKTLQMQEKSAFGFYAGSGAFYVLTLTNPQAMERIAPQMSEASRRLDVNILHRLILEQHLHINDEKLARQAHIDYIKDLGDAIEQSVGRIDRGQAQAVFFLNPTPMSHVRAVAEAGEKMPQKSTFFYPKVFSGLTIYTVGAVPQKTVQRSLKQECSR